MLMCNVVIPFRIGCVHVINHVHCGTMLYHEIPDVFNIKVDGGNRKISYGNEKIILLNNILFHCTLHKIDYIILSI